MINQPMTEAGRETVKEMFDDVTARLKKDAELIEKELAKYYTGEDGDIIPLINAQKYSLFAGGKRIRPYLMLEFCRLFGGDEKKAIPFACAIEMIHTYSLIHDDLPAMDNDDLRRGKPTNHKVFGEATAILAGDALLTKAFETAASNRSVNDKTALAVTVLLAKAAGTFGMVGGQQIDLSGESQKLNFETLKKLQRMKTGALIVAAVKIGCITAGLCDDDEKMRDAVEYADNIGLAFQIKDDILDCIGTEENIGKSVGSDAKSEKTTFLSYFSIAKAEEYAKMLTESAALSISKYFGSRNLIELAYFLYHRNY